MTEAKKLRIRNRYFELFIKLNINEPNFKFSSNKDLLKDVLKKNKFPTLDRLKNIFENFEFHDRGRLIKLEDFAFQLELEKNRNFPYWRILCQTNVLTTSRKLLQAFTKILFSDQKSESFNVKIVTFENVNIFRKIFKNLKMETRLLLENSPWFPGYFSNNILLVISLLKKQDVKEFFKRNINRDITNNYY